MVIGGQAILLYGEPRLTKDIDITLGVGVEGFVQISDLVRGLMLKVLVDDPEVFAEVKSYMKTEYGLPKRSFSAKNDEAVESWEEKNIKIKLKHNEKSWETKLAFYYTPISKNIDEEVQEEEFTEKRIRILPPEKRETYDSHPLLVF